MRVAIALLLLILVTLPAFGAGEPDVTLPAADAYEQQLAQKRKEKELLDIDLEIAQRRKALAELDMDAANTPSAPTFPRLVRVIRFGKKTFGEFGVGKNSVRAEVGDYVNTAWRLTAWERNAAILTHTGNGERHVAVLGAVAEEVQPVKQPPAGQREP
jgi:hypothetical protein